MAVTLEMTLAEWLADSTAGQMEELKDGRLAHWLVDYLADLKVEYLVETLAELMVDH